MKTNIPLYNISKYLSDNGIEHEVRSTQINVSRDSIVAKYPQIFPEDAYDLLLKELGESFQTRFYYWGKNDDYLFLIEID